MKPAKQEKKNYIGHLIQNRVMVTLVAVAAVLLFCFSGWNCGQAYATYFSDKDAEFDHRLAITTDTEALIEHYQNQEAKLDNSKENEKYVENTSSSETGQSVDDAGNAETSSGAWIGIENGSAVITQEPEKTPEEIEAERRAALIAGAEFPYYLKVNRRQNCITVYQIDELGTYTIPVKAMICSTGKNNATPKGVFHTSDQYLWRELNGGVYGQYATRVYKGVLLHSVPYSRKSKDSLYAGKYNKLGSQASMGCIRLTVADAKWVLENCPSGTAVEVYEEDDPGPLGKPEAAILDSEDSRSHWDPTDPDEGNPWNAQ